VGQLPTMRCVQVRESELGDADAIAHVQVETWRAAYRGIVPDMYLDDMDVSERAERWRQRSTEHRSTWVAECDSKVVGFVAFGACRDGDVSSAVGELHAIYVLPDRWRRGVGRALHDRCVAELGGRGFDEATLWALDANPGAKAFYDALGWEADGATVPHDFAGTEMILVRYRRSL
jgi:GNAT superfamily N-acetyltransferase